jgi:hypothetical protein
MANERRPDDLCEVWRGQKVEHNQMTLAEIREKASKFQRRIRFRNLKEYGAYAAVVAFFGFSMGAYPPLMRAGAWLCIAGMLYSAYQMHRRGSSKTVAAGWEPESCLSFHRRELERQRDLLLSIWSWYLGPLIPGLALLMIGGGVARPGHLKHAWAAVSLYLALIAVGFWFVARLNRRAAQRLQRQIDELGALSTER